MSNFETSNNTMSSRLTTCVRFEKVAKLDATGSTTETTTARID